MKITKGINISIYQQATVLMLVALAFFALLNCIMRMLTPSFDPYVILGYRSLFTLIFAAMALPFISLKTSGYKNFNRINLLKSFSDLASIPLWLMALSHMQITQVVSIAFLTPIICAVFAAILLQDRMSSAKWVACVMGFIGACIIANPNMQGFNYYSLFVLVTCVLWASSGIMIKKLTSKQQHPLIIILFNNGLLALFTLPFLMASGKLPNREELYLMLAMGLIAFVGNLALASAYMRTQITNLLPYEYIKLIFTAIFAFMLFGEVITATTIIGSTIILVASLYIASRREKADKLPLQTRV